MALRITTKLNGVTVQDAYVRITSATCNKNILAFQADFLASVNERVPFKTAAYEGQHDLDGANAIKQAYEMLKTLPEFANAQDC
jgi:hypothetical protein